MRPNKLKSRSFAAEKSLLQGHSRRQEAYALKALSSAKHFYKPDGTGRSAISLSQFSDWLMVRVVSQGLKKLVLRLQLTHGHNIFHLLERGGFYICKATQEMYIKQYCLGTSERSFGGTFWGRPVPGSSHGVLLGYTLKETKKQKIKVFSWMVLFLVEDSKPMRKIRLSKCCVILIIGEILKQGINHSELEELGKKLKWKRWKIRMVGMMGSDNWLVWVLWNNPNLKYSVLLTLWEALEFKNLSD